MMTEHFQERPQRTPWHRFLGRGLELSVGLVQVQVESEVQISSEPPRIDIVLLRRETEQWTDAQRAMLPDGVRDTSAADILLEFKYSESLTQDAILQATAYEYFYRTSRGMASDQVQIFILCAKTPHAARLADFEYEEGEWPGVYRSQNRYIAHITLVVLNQLQAESQNALVKTFASRSQEKSKAFELLQQNWQLSTELWAMLDGLQTIWSLPEGVKMSEALTVEQVMKIGETSKRILLEHLSPEELDLYINPEYKQQMHEQGIEQGIQTTIEQLLEKRFGIVPGTLSARLRACTLEQLQALVNPALDAPNLETFLAYVPEIDEDDA